MSRSSLVLLLSLVIVAPAAQAARCTDTSAFQSTLEAVEAAVPCASATNKHGRYVKQAKKAIGARLRGGCKKLFAKNYLSRSTCGRTGFVVCCGEDGKGKVVKASQQARKCRNLEACTETAPQSVGAGCDQSGCKPTTTTTTTTLVASTSTTSTSTSTTTTTTCVTGLGEAFSLEFVLTAAGGVCGTTQDAGGAVLKELTCGGLNIGGGASVVGEGPTPDGSTSLFALNCCGDDCQIGPTSAAPAPNTPGGDCTDVGCNFGTPLPIPNPAIPVLTTCVANTWSAPASGTLDRATGSSTTSVPLASDIYLTGNLAQPCPRCSVAGSPDSPATGVCDRGSNQGQPCTTTSSTGLTRDCPTGGANPPALPCLPGGMGPCADGSHVGVISVDLTPLTTGVASKTTPDGLFCPNQTDIQVGCFGDDNCRTITENGTPAGRITVGTPIPATLASVFCIAATGNGLVDGSANLPGPGAVSLPGMFTVKATGSTTTLPPTTTIPTTTTTTTTTVPTTTTTTVSTSSTTTVASSSTTTTTTDGTTTTTVPLSTLDFTLGTPGGTCGSVQDGTGATLRNLTCGGLSIGGGRGIVPEGPTPDGAVSRFALSCAGSACTLGPTSAIPPVNTAGPDCTDTGCNFGTPLPIPNPGIPVITTCVLNTWAQPASGTVDLATGVSSTSVPLNSDIYLTGNLAQPCPKCSAGGTPSSPGTGTCDRGPRAGMACTSTSSTGITRDCLTGGANPPTLPCTPGGGLCVDGSHVGVIQVNLSPLTTGTASATSPTGQFCPGQTTQAAGCFGLGGPNGCRTITENGSPAGPITPGVAANATLASVFCIAATGNGIVDPSADLPGPGAVSLPGTFVAN